MRLPLMLPLTLAFVILAVAACGGSGTATTAPSTGPSLVAPTPAGSRPSSPAVLTFVSPTANQTTNISPTTGHVHLYVDNALVSMNYQLSQDLPVHPGTYVMYAEFVAADHAPFDPRIKTPVIIFTVQ
jgi:hypothetical protein